MNKLISIGVVFLLVIGAATPLPDFVQEWLGEEPLTKERIVQELLEYFQMEDPHGVPVLDIPEVFEYPDSIKMTQIVLNNAKIRGHSGIRFEYINANLTSLMVEAKVSLPYANVEGDYIWSGIWSTSEGLVNITMTEIDVGAKFYIGVSNDGILEITNMEISIEYKDLDLYFENLAMAESIAVRAADTFFNSFVRPIITDTLRDMVIEKGNGILKEKLASHTFPTTISPVDFAIASARSEIRARGFDPMQVEDEQLKQYVGSSPTLSNLKITGLTTIHRTHEISTQFIDNRVYVTIQIGTQEVKAATDWTMSAALLPSFGGHLDIEVESLAIIVEAQQDADIRHPPVLRKIDIKLGNLAVHSSGERTMDYLIEAVVNVVPNALRNVIMKAIKGPLQQIIQKRLNALDLEKIIVDLMEKKQAQDQMLGDES
ncbi:uncharacterized protein LOC143035068 [Oratosquilla oratoria]|uniref:uncharacterized protein LOC143035068 n=1 Tax=Oratosquilla oratoria TaxID=337810 RepID=UPI003F777AD3